MRKNELRKEIDSLLSQLDKIESIERKSKNTPYLGKCYRARNSYSCPSKESDYWLFYLKIIDADDGLIAVFFETDKDGRISIDREYGVSSSTLDTYEQISPASFARAFKRLTGDISRLIEQTTKEQ